MVEIAGDTYGAILAFKTLSNSIAQLTSVADPFVSSTNPGWRYRVTNSRLRRCTRPPRSEHNERFSLRPCLDKPQPGHDQRSVPLSANCNARFMHALGPDGANVDDGNSSRAAREKNSKETSFSMCAFSIGWGYPNQAGKETYPGQGRQSPY
jgi:hypothetical protein